MNLIIVTVVKDDPIGLKLTGDSILSQSGAVIWKIVTPFNHSETHSHSSKLLLEGKVTQILEDEGHGVYSAMNKAIDSTSPQDWLWYLNAGDVLASTNSYQTVFKKISSTSSRWAYGGHFLGSGNGEILGEVSSPKEFKVSNQLFAKKYISHQATIFQASLLNDLGGFDEAFTIAADWDLMARASKTESPTRISESVCVFYMGGLSSHARQKSNVELLKLRYRHLPRKYLFKSSVWFGYRFFRNIFVQSFEKKFSETANSARKLRLKSKARHRQFD